MGDIQTCVCWGRRSIDARSVSYGGIGVAKSRPSTVVILLTTIVGLAPLLGGVNASTETSKVAQTGQAQRVLGVNSRLSAAESSFKSPVGLAGSVESAKLFTRAECNLSLLSSSTSLQLVTLRGGAPGANLSPWLAALWTDIETLNPIYWYFDPSAVGHADGPSSSFESNAWLKFDMNDRYIDYLPYGLQPTNIRLPRAYSPSGKSKTKNVVRLSRSIERTKRR